MHPDQQSSPVSVWQLASHRYQRQSRRAARLDRIFRQFALVFFRSASGFESGFRVLSRVQIRVRKESKMVIGLKDESPDSHCFACVRPSVFARSAIKTGNKQIFFLNIFIDAVMRSLTAVATFLDATERHQFR